MADNTIKKPHDVDYINDIPGLDGDHNVLAQQIVDDCPDYDELNDAPDFSDTPEPNNSDPFKQSFYQMGAPVYAYQDLLKAGRQNIKVKGFWFDVNTFENLIDCYTPYDTIPLILRCSISDLSRFCTYVYGMDYPMTFKVLTGITDSFMRKTFKGLSQAGNPTAIKLVGEHFMGLKETQQAEAINITINNDLKKSDGGTNGEGGYRV